MDGLKSEDVSPDYESDSSENQNTSSALLTSPPASDQLRAAEQSPVASEGPPGKKKRSSFTIAYKLEVVAYAEKYGLRSASRWFGVEETLLRRWKDLKPYMEMMKDADKTLKRRLPWVAKRVKDHTSTIPVSMYCCSDGSLRCSCALNGKNCALVDSILSTCLTYIWVRFAYVSSVVGTCEHFRPVLECCL